LITCTINYWWSKDYLKVEIYREKKKNVFALLQIFN